METPTETNPMMELLEMMRGDMNKREVAIQVLESQMLKNLIENKGHVQKLRIKTQELDMDARAIKIADIFTKAYEMGGGFNKPCHEDYGSEMIRLLDQKYGGCFEDGWGIGFGLTPSDIRKQGLEDLEEIQRLIEKTANANFTEAAGILERYLDQSIYEGSLGEHWRAVADCRNLENAIDPRDLDSGEYGKKYHINVNWKLMWTKEGGLMVRSEELAHDASEVCYEGQPKIDM